MAEENLLNSKVQAVENPLHSADYWVGVIRTKGRANLSSKFNPSWKMNGKPLASYNNDIGVSDLTNFVTVDPFNPDRPRSDFSYLTWIRRGDMPSSLRIAGIIAQLQNIPEAERHGVNYLAVGEAFDEKTAPELMKALGASGLWQSVSYCAWSNNPVPDSRGDNFYFFTSQ